MTTAMPCPSCSTPTKPYDTEPWPEMNELTYAYECRCGNVWTKAMETTRRVRFIPASKILMEAWQAEQYDVIDAAREVLPEEWRVLPDGRSTAKAIANRAHSLRKERKDAKTPAPSFDCEVCHRTIGKWRGHNVTTDGRIICSGCIPDNSKPLHREWFPDCGVDWHDLYDHLRYVHSDRLAVAAALGLWDTKNITAADATHLKSPEY